MTFFSGRWPVVLPLFLCIAALGAGCSRSCSDTPSYQTGSDFEKRLDAIIFDDTQDLQALVTLLETARTVPSARLIWKGRRYACQWAIQQQQYPIADVQCHKLFESLKGEPGSEIGEGVYTELLRHMIWRWLNTDDLEKAKNAVFYGDVTIKHMMDRGYTVTLAEQAEFALLRGIVFWKRGYDSAAKKSLEEARRKALNAIGQRPELALQALETLGDFHVAQGDSQSALVAYRQGMEQCVGLGNRSAAAAIRFRLKLASVQFTEGRLSDAYAWLTQAQPLCGDDPRTSPLREKAPKEMQLCILVWQNVEKVTAALKNEGRRNHAQQVLKRWRDFYYPGQGESSPDAP